MSEVNLEIRTSVNVAEFKPPNREKYTRELDYYVAVCEHFNRWASYAVTVNVELSKSPTEDDKVETTLEKPLGL